MSEKETILDADPAALTPGMRICAITFEQLSSSVDVPYNKKKQAKYVIQEEPVESKIYKEK